MDRAAAGPPGGGHSQQLAEVSRAPSQLPFSRDQFARLTGVRSGSVLPTRSGWFDLCCTAAPMCPGAVSLARAARRCVSDRVSRTRLPGEQPHRGASRQAQHVGRKKGKQGERMRRGQKPSAQATGQSGAEGAPMFARSSRKAASSYAELGKEQRGEFSSQAWPLS